MFRKISKSSDLKVQIVGFQKLVKELTVQNTGLTVELGKVNDQLSTLQGRILNMRSDAVKREKEVVTKERTRTNLMFSKNDEEYPQTHGRIKQPDVKNVPFSEVPKAYKALSNSDKFKNHAKESHIPAAVWNFVRMAENDVPMSPAQYEYSYSILNQKQNNWIKKFYGPALRAGGLKCKDSQIAQKKQEITA